MKRTVIRTAAALLFLSVFICTGCTGCTGGGNEPADVTTAATTAVPEDNDILTDGALYRIKSLYNGNSMTTYNFGTSNMCDIKLYKYDNDLSQMWRAIKRSDGNYVLENMSSGLFLTARITSRLLCGKTVADSSDADIWTVEQDGDSFYLKNSETGIYVGILDDDTEENAYVCASELTSPAQSVAWSFIKVSDGNGEYPRLLILSGDYKGSTSTPEIAKYNGVYYSFNMTGPITIKMSRDLQGWAKIGTAWPTKPSWLMSTFGYESIWAPGIYKIGEKYFLYYCVSSSGSQNSGIGVSINTTLNPDDPNYKWVDQGMVIRSYSGYAYNCIDPNIIMDEDGQPWLVFGSHWSGIYVRKINPDTGMLDLSDTTEYNIGAGGATEAPYMIKHGDYYYLFVARGTFSTGYYWAVARSESIFGPFVNKTGSAALDGGFTRLSEYKQGIQAAAHASVFLDDDGTYYMVSESWENRDVSTTPVILHISSIVWTEDGWPVTVLDKNVLNALGE